MEDFRLVQGVHVPNLNGIFESFAMQQHENYSIIIVNVSAENIDKIFRLMCAKVETPGFLLIEHGTNIKIESELRTSDSDPFHKDVYFLDGLYFDDFIEVYNRFDTLLTEDGKINYGFSSHQTTDEVFVGPYKVFYIMTNEPCKYIKILKQNGIQKVDQIKTVWDTFTQDTPGVRTIIKINDIDIYEMVERLKLKGLYLAERHVE